MIVTTKSFLAQYHISIKWISVDLISFPYFIIFSLKLFLKIKNNIKHMTNIDSIDHEMRSDTNIFFDISEHISNILSEIDRLITQLSIIDNIFCAYTKQNISLVFERREDVFLRFCLESRKYSSRMSIGHKLSSDL